MKNGTNSNRKLQKDVFDLEVFGSFLHSIARFNYGFCFVTQKQCETTYLDKH